MASARALAALGPEAAPATMELTRLLEYGDPSKVAAAAFVLSEIGPRALEQEPALVDALIRSMAHEDAEVRHWSVVALARLGSRAKAAIPALVTALSDADEGVRLVTAHALGEFMSAANDAIEPLLAMLQDPSQSVRSAAAKALGLIAPDGERFAEALTRLLDDPVPSVRAYAVEALGNLAPSDNAASAHLTRCLNDDSPGVRAKAAEAVPKLPNPSDELVRALAGRFGDADDAVRIQVADAFRQLDTAAAPAVPQLMERLRDKDETVRFHAVEIIEAAAPHNRPALAAAIVALTRCLHDESGLASSRATMALKALNRLSAAADSSVFDAMNSTEDAERLAATEAVRFLRRDDPRILAALRQLQRDPNALVRAAACASLAELGRPAREYLPTLMGMLNDPTLTAPLAAVKALGGIAAPGGAPAALEALNACREHANPVVRARIHRTLDTIEREEKSGERSPTE